MNMEITQVFKVIDNINAIYEIRNRMTSKEQAYLLDGSIENGKIVIEDYYEIENIIFSSIDKIEIDKKYLYAGLKTLSQHNKVGIFLHTHINQNAENLTESETDKVFFHSVYSVWKEITKKDIPIIFAIMGKENVIFECYYMDRIFDIPFASKYDHYDPENWELKLIYDIDYVYGAVFHVRTKQFRKVALSQIVILQKWVQKYANNELTEFESLAFKKYIVENFGFMDNKVQYASEISCIKTGIINQLQFMMQLGCNLSCKYCYAHSGTYDYGHNVIMEKDSAIQILDRLIENGIHTIHKINFMGGEPSLFPNTIADICEYIRLLVERNSLKMIPNYYMITNATCISDDLIKIIQKNDIKLTISLDGTKLVNDKLRVYKDGSGTYDAVINTIKKLQESGVSPKMVEATYTSVHEELGITRENVRNDIMQKTGVDKIIIADCEGEYAPSSSVIIHNMEVKNIIKGDLNEVYSVGKMCKQLSNKTFFNDIYCSAGYHDLTVLGNGEVYPCHRFVSDRTTGITNLFHEDCEFEIYNLPNKNKHKQCKSCWAANFCKQCNWLLRDENMELDCRNQLADLEKKMLYIMNITESDKKELEEIINEEK